MRIAVNSQQRLGCSMKPTTSTGSPTAGDASVPGLLLGDSKEGQVQGQKETEGHNKWQRVVDVIHRQRLESTEGTRITTRPQRWHQVEVPERRARRCSGLQLLGGHRSAPQDCTPMLH